MKKEENRSTKRRMGKKDAGTYEGMKLEGREVPHKQGGERSKRVRVSLFRKAVYGQRQRAERESRAAVWDPLHFLFPKIFSLVGVRR